MSLIYARDLVKTYTTEEVEMQGLRKVDFDIAGARSWPSWGCWEAGRPLS